MSIPGAGTILLAIAVLLVCITIASYLRCREFQSKHRTWLIIAAIFSVVSLTIAQ